MANPQGSDNYDFNLIGTDKQPFIGYISTKDPTTVTPLAMVQGSLNVLKTLAETVGNRCGRKLFGPLNASEDAVKASFVWDTSTGRTYIMQVLASGLLQAYIDGVWYTLLSGLTKTRFTFDTWWDSIQKIDILLMGNGEENIKSWTGGITTFDSAVQTAEGAVWDYTLNAGASGTFTVGQILTVMGGDSNATLEVISLSGPFPSVRLLTQGSGYSVGTTTAEEGANSIDMTISEVRTIYTVTKEGATFFSEERFDNTNQGLVPQGGPGTSVSDTSNRFVLDGNEYAYFDSIGTTLTGVSGYSDSSLNPTTATTGDTIIQSVIDNDPPVTGFAVDIVSVLGNQLFVASYSDRTVYISASMNSEDSTGFSDFTNAGAYVDGDPDFVILDESPTGMVPKEQAMYISAGTRDWYIVTPNSIPPISFTGSDGATRFVVTEVIKKRGAVKTAALGQEFIETVGDDIIFLDQDNQLRSFGTFRNLFQPKFPSLSQAVREELASEDFTGGQLKAIDDYIYVIAPISGKTYLRQTRDTVNDDGNVVAERLWHPPQTWNISSVDTYLGEILGFSASNPQMYQLWNTGQWHDDTPDGSALYVCKMRMAYMQFGKRYRVGSFDKAYLEGYILNHSDLTARFFYDYQAASDYQEKVLSSTASTAVLYGGDGVTLIGGSIVGNTTIGGGIRNADYSNPLPKFRAIANMNQADCFEYQIELVSEEADSRWEIICLGTNGNLSTNYPVQIQLPY